MRRFMFDTGSQGRMRDVGLLVLRIGLAGGLAVIHGYGKVEGLLAGSSQFPDPLGIGPTLSLGLAAFAEFVCALAVLLGIGARLATIPVIVTMAVAFFVYHGGDPLEDRELALLYLVGFVTLFLTGPGRYSIDQIWSKKIGR